MLFKHKDYDEEYSLSDAINSVLTPTAYRGALEDIELHVEKNRKFNQNLGQILLDKGILSKSEAASLLNKTENNPSEDSEYWEEYWNAVSEVV